MDVNYIFSISAAGMSFERARFEVASLNIANANAMHSPNGPNFQPLMVNARLVPLRNTTRFEAVFEQERGGVSDPLQVAVSEVGPAGIAPKKVHEPNNPWADRQGFVTYPGVDNAKEMITLLSATRAYEANVAAFNMAKTMAIKTLEIGGNS